MLQGLIPNTNIQIRIAVASALCSTALAAQADWPEYRGNYQRTAYRLQDAIPSEWQEAWSFEGLNPPNQAWPQPARGSLWQNLESLSARVTEDRGHVPVIAQDRRGQCFVLIASSSDNSLTCLSHAAGHIVWQLRFRAPLRFAPSVVEGVVYFGCDDGVVRAVALETGSSIWSTRIGPELPWIFANGNFVSPHPIRTSVMAINGMVVAHAGLFPSQGVYSVALDGQTGEPIWRRHVERSPQGYLLVEPNPSRVFVPCGRAEPYMISAADGQFQSQLPSTGGTFCMITEEAFFSGPGNANTVNAYSGQSNSQMLALNGNCVAAGNGLVWSANGKQLTCQPLNGLNSGKPESAAWKVDSDLQSDLIVSGTRDRLWLFSAGGRQIEVRDAMTGQLVTTLSLPAHASPAADSDSIQYLAVHGDDQASLLVATTSSGAVYAWRGVGDKKQAAGNQPADAPPSSSNLVESSVAGAHGEVAVSGTRESRELRQEMETVSEKLKPLLASLPSSRGLALVTGDPAGITVRALLEQSELQVLWLAQNEALATSQLPAMRSQGLDSFRVTLWNGAELTTNLPLASRLMNLAVYDEGCGIDRAEFMRVLTDGSGLLVDSDLTQFVVKPQIQGSGVWRHQYGSPANLASSNDESVGNANGFRLQWFGGVGPNRMPDRHLRGPAPLAAGSTLVMHGDGVLIGVDPANGIERWELALPHPAMRYVMPFDGGYTCLTPDGKQLFVAAGEVIWNVDAERGTVRDEIGLPDFASDMQWGYLAEENGRLLATCMRTPAPRLSLPRATARASYSDQDYRSERPLVCSRHLCSLQPAGNVDWSYHADGLIPHGSISVDSRSQRLVFVEGRSEQCVAHPTDRATLGELLQDAYLRCLDMETGKLVWERPLSWAEVRNVLYTQVVDNKITLVSSSSSTTRATYVAKVISLDDGHQIWETEHEHVRSGLYHGEQVHHPVITTDSQQRKLFVVEPYIYDLESGEKVLPAGETSDWSLQRPGHSCGTITGAGSCLFFRASNPTVLNVNSTSAERFTKLSPTRPSCWINMIPAGGRLLIPEGSASCVCSYPLQTSMAFVPISSPPPLLPELLPD